MLKGRVSSLPIVRMLIILALLCSTAGSTPISPQQQLDRELYDLFEAAMNACYAEQFDKAIEVSSLIRERFPEEPAGVFGLLMAYQTMERNYRVKLFEGQIDSLLELSVDLSKQALKKNNRDGRNYFYLGTAYGFRCIFCVQQGRWMDAFKDGSQVLKNFNKAVAYSPEFYDAYYGLGLYKYWLGAKGPMRYLPFARKNRGEGIRQMAITMEKGRFLAVNAMYGLIAVYYNERQFEKALEIADRLYEHYPQNPTLNYRRGRLQIELGQWQAALTSFERLHDILRRAEHQSLSYQVECLYQMARCRYELGDYAESKRLCQDALVLERQVDLARELEGPVDKFGDIQKQLHELNDKVKSHDITGVASESE